MSLLGPESQQVAALLFCCCCRVVARRWDGDGDGDGDEDGDDYFHLAQNSLPGCREERSERGPTKTSVNRTASPFPLPFPFAPDAILFKSFYIRWPQSTPPHRPPSLLQRRGHHSALARLLPECTLLSSGVRPLPPPPLNHHL